MKRLFENGVLDIYRKVVKLQDWEVRGYVRFFQGKRCLKRIRNKEIWDKGQVIGDGIIGKERVVDGSYLFDEWMSEG